MRVLARVCTGDDDEQMRVRVAVYRDVFERFLAEGPGDRNGRCDLSELGRLGIERDCVGLAGWRDVHHVHDHDRVSLSVDDVVNVKKISLSADLLIS